MAWRRRRRVGGVASWRGVARSSFRRRRRGVVGGVVVAWCCVALVVRGVGWLVGDVVAWRRSSWRRWLVVVGCVVGWLVVASWLVASASSHRGVGGAAWRRRCVAWSRRRRRRVVASRGVVVVASWRRLVGVGVASSCASSSSVCVGVSVRGWRGVASSRRVASRASRRASRRASSASRGVRRVVGVGSSSSRRRGGVVTSRRVRASRGVRVACVA
ncbi:hypothetical protein ACXZ9C_10775 [Streptococcus agalactiae]